ncbi:MAG: hypothetical protein AB7G68_06140 [Nitrospiraceae bacterium]
MRRLSSIFSRARFLIVFIFLYQLLLSQGCSVGSSAVPSQHRAPQSTIYYEEVADWSFEAAHPATIDQALIKQVLHGVYVSDRSSSYTGSADGAKPMKVFSDEDVKHLAPLLAHALSQAQPEYVVAFRLSSSAGSGSEPTAGTLYVKDELLHVTLTAYQGNLAKEDSSLTSEAAARAVSFVPASAGHTQKADPTIALGQRGLTTLAIACDALNKKEEPAPAQVAATVAPSDMKPSEAPRPTLMASASPDDLKTSDMAAAQETEMMGLKEQELKEAQRTIARKDAKIDRLRRDLESMRQQLEAKDKELRQVKTRPASTKREKRGTAEVIIR